MQPNSKLFAKSKALWGVLIAALSAAIYHRTGVNVSGYVDPLQQSIQAIIVALPPLVSALGVFVGLVLNIVGRVKAAQPLHLIPGAPSATLPLSPLTKTTLLFIGVGLVSILGLVACGSTNGGSTGPLPPSVTSTGTATATGATSTASTDIELALPLIRTGAAVATGGVLNFAVTDPAKRTALAGKMYTAASAVYSLSGGTFPTPAQFQSSIIAFGGSQKDAAYSQFAVAISGLYSSYYSKLITGDKKTAVDLLNAIAGGVEDATQAYVTTPPPAASAALWIPEGNDTGDVVTVSF